MTAKQAVVKKCSQVLRISELKLSCKLEVSSWNAGTLPQILLNGKLIQGINEHLFSILRDIVFWVTEISKNSSYYLNLYSSVTDFVYHILRNTGLLRELTEPNLVV